MVILEELFQCSELVIYDSCYSCAYNTSQQENYIHWEQKILLFTRANKSFYVLLT